MRSADAVTVLRVLLIVAAAYLVVLKYSPVLITLIIAVAMSMDAIDGYMAIREASRGTVTLPMYLSSLIGNKNSKGIVKKFKSKLSKSSKFGARIDVAGDRAVEYILWATYTYLNVLPLFVIIIVIIRHSFVDAVMAARGTSSKMKTKFAAVVYSSNLWRGGINVVKFASFSYLAFAYVLGYPIWIGYALVAVLVAYILLRGAAEIYEAYS
jgi:phosphatidylglycerophosphate synthase